jgi:hypothetical protein
MYVNSSVAVTRKKARFPALGTGGSSGTRLQALQPMPMKFYMSSATRCCIGAYISFLFILQCHRMAHAGSLDPKIGVNTALLVAMCTGANLNDYPPSASGRAASKKICEPPATLHSKCSIDATNTFSDATAFQCLYAFPDVNEEQSFPFSGVSIVKNDGTDFGTTDKVKVMITAFYSDIALDRSVCIGCTITEHPNPLLHASKVEIQGLAAPVNALLAVALIVPRKFENSARMVSPCLAGSRCSGARPSPIEVIEVVAALDGGSYPSNYDAYNSSTFPTSAERFFVRIVPLNNAPNFDAGNPMKNFVACYDCVGLKGLEPDFGQYFTFEGSSQTITISGLVAKDDDLFESCNTVTACLSRQISVTIDTVVGVVRLNTLSDLSLQPTGSTTLQSFVASLDASNAAIRSLLYNVIGPTTDPASPSRSFNTQRLLGLPEAVEVTVSDQGFSGQSGFANSSKIRFPITIVAMNQAPKVAPAPSLSNSLEGVTITLSGPTFSDDDLSDVRLRPTFVNT